jgi:hypothetical protein
MTPALLGALAFASGAALEGFALFWVSACERGRAGKAALFSLLFGLAQVAGIGVSLSDLRVAPWYVLGLAAGTYFGVRLKNGRMK